MMTLTETTAGSATVVGVAGDVDLSTATRLSDRLVELIEQPVSAVVVDLGEVTFLDSTGLTVLVVAARTASAGNVPLMLARPTRNIVDLLTVTGLTQLIPIFDTVAEALASLGGH